MTLITRMSRLFRADMNAVLDRMEEPDVVLRQAIRDMQAAVSAGERQLQALELRREQTASRTAGLETRLRQADEELGVCLDAGNDDLARSVIQRKLSLERCLAETADQVERLERTMAEQQRVLERRRRELEDVRSKADVFDVSDRDGANAPAPVAVSSDEVEVALLKEKQRRGRS